MMDAPARPAQRPLCQGLARACHGLPRPPAARPIRPGTPRISRDCGDRSACNVKAATAGRLARRPGGSGG